MVKMVKISKGPAAAAMLLLLPPLWTDKGSAVEGHFLPSHVEDQNRQSLSFDVTHKKAPMLRISGLIISDIHC